MIDVVAGPAEAAHRAGEPAHSTPTMATHERIDVNPKVMLGKPVIRGTRISVELIVRKLGEGATEAELVDAYPHLTVDDIRAALAYAADAVALDESAGVASGDAASAR